MLKAHAGRSPFPPETILLVDDEPALRQFLSLALTRAGYEVYEARHGREALDLFAECGPSIDLVLTDMRMPVMGGVELARHLRAQDPQVRVLCISGYAGEEGECPGEFLAKPFSKNELLAKVREVLDRRSHGGAPGSAPATRS